MAPEAVIGILITAISVLAGVIGLLWKLFLQPLVAEMISLVKVMKEEQPKQTEALADIRSSNKAIKHGTAQLVKSQGEEMEVLGRIENGVKAGACRQMPAMIALASLLWLPFIAMAAPQDAVVRLRLMLGGGRQISGSGTVIATAPGWSLILTARHMYTDDHDRIDPRMCRLPHEYDIALPAGVEPKKGAGSKVLSISNHADVALIRYNFGPLPYVTPVAPAGLKPGECLSVGFDKSEIPPRVKVAHILNSDSVRTMTREVPWHGRSGGALIDKRTGYLVGVVSAYTGNGNRHDDGRADVLPGREGVYASHEAILHLLTHAKGLPEGFKIGGSVLPDLAAAPAPSLRREIAAANRIPNRSGSQCVWSSLETLARHHGISAAYDLTARYGGTAGPGNVQAALSARRVKFKQWGPGPTDISRIKEACESGLYCMIGVHGVHAIVCCGCDDRVVSVIDNCGPKALQTQAWTLERFRNSWDGWVCVLYPDAPIGAPELASPAPRRAAPYPGAMPYPGFAPSLPCPS